MWSLTVLLSPPKLYILSPQIGEKHFFFFGCSFVSFFIMVMVRMAIGWGRTKGWSSSFVLSHPYPTPHNGKNFIVPCITVPQGLVKPCPHPVKPYFLLIFPTTIAYIYIYIYIFFNETYFINKNIFEITTKFITSNPINF